MPFRDEAARTIRRAVLIRRVENALALAVARRVVQAYADLEALLRGRPLDDVSEGRRRARVEAIDRQAAEILRDAYRDLRSTTTTQLTEVANQFGRSAVDEVTRRLTAAGVDLTPLRLPTPAQFRELVRYHPMQGATLGQWWRGFERQGVERFRRIVTDGMIRRETTDQIVRRVRGLVIHRNAQRRFQGGAYQVAHREAEVLVRTAVHDVGNGAAVTSYKANARYVQGVEWLATLDSRTCFVGSTPVLTPNGERPIGTLATGESVVSSGGERQLLGTMSRPHHGPLVALETSANRVVIATPDHRIWVRGVGWKELAALAPGDALESPDDQPVHVRRLVQFSLTKAHHSKASALECRGLAGVFDWVRVPVGAVDLNGNAEVWQEEVHQQPSDLGLLSEPDTGHFHRHADEGFDPRLAAIESVASEVAEAGIGGRSLPLALATVEAVIEYGRATAGLGAVDASAVNAPGARRSDGLPASGARVVSGGLVATGNRAVQVSLGVTARDRELLAAGDAGLGDLSVACVASTGTVGSGLGAGNLERGTAMPTDLRLVSGSSAVETLPAAVDGAGRPRWAIELLATLTALTSERHFAQFSEVVDEYLTRGNITVYDLTVKADHAFFAGGILAHNCGECGALDGRAWPLNAVDLRRPPAHPQCRCTVIPVIVGLPRRPRVAYDQWLVEQPATTQDAILGKRRGKLYREHRIALDKLIREDGTLLPLAQLERRLALRDTG